MSGFEFTPAGIVPLGSYTPAQKEGAIAGATADVPGPIESPQLHAVRVAFKESTAVTLRHPDLALKPKDVIRLARQRLKDVEREIKRLHKLETERDELKRLLAAARPVAIVRPIRSA